MAVQTAQLTQAQVELVKRTVALGASNDELQLFLYTAARTGLDPLTKQIYCIKRKARNPDGSWRDTMSIQTGIDGYRAIAERSGTLAGIDDAQYDTETAAHPGKASVTVWRIVNGTRVSFGASARWDEYMQGRDGVPQGLWARMPYLMLGKCAEALALRKAFPHDLSGVYTHEEMMQADSQQAAVEVAAVQAPVARPDLPANLQPDQPPATPEAAALRDKIIALAAKLGIKYEAPGVLFRNRLAVQYAVDVSNPEDAINKLEVLIAERADAEPPVIQLDQ